jgi:LPXTG-site transpeptidase (sortase) family protein
MQSGISLKRRTSFTVIVEIVVFTIIIFFLGFCLGRQVIYHTQLDPFNSRQVSQNLINSKAVESIQNIALSEQASLGLPIRLKIPKINLDAIIESAGFTADGAVDVPKGPANVSWFNLGSRPGENGSSVIVGHYGIWKNGQGSVFNNLYQLRQGDQLFVEDDKGAIIAFVVRESRRYNPDENAPEVFNSSDGKPHLNLITCDGAWDEISKTYSQRLVVFTDKL